MGRQILGRGPAHRPRGDVRRGGAALRPARRADRPPPSRRGPLDRRPADHRDRQGHLARRPAARHGRADRRAERRRGRPAVRRRPQPARRGPRPRLHLPPLRRGLRPLRHRHRHARRLLHRHQDDRRDHAVRAGLADGRPRRRRPVPQGGRRDRRAGPAGARPQPRRRLPRHRPSRSAPARSSAWPAWSAPGAARSRARSSASTPTTPGRSRCPGRPVKAQRPALRDPRRHGVRPRGPPQAGPGHRLLGRPQRRRRHPPQHREGRAAHLRHGEPGRRPLGRTPGGEDQRARHDRGHDERRQPAEGRHRQVAGHRPQAADHRRAHPRHRRRHQGRGAPAALRARRAGPRDPDDLLRAARGPRHGRPRRSSCARAGSPPSSTAPTPPPRPSCTPPPTTWRTAR